MLVASPYSARVLSTSSLELKTLKLTHAACPITAQMGFNRIYKKTHQFVDLVIMFKSVTKWCDTVLTPAVMPELIRNDVKSAQTKRPGAVFLGIPEDIVTMPVPVEGQTLPVNRVYADVPSPSKISRAEAVL